MRRGWIYVVLAVGLIVTPGIVRGTEEPARLLAASPQTVCPLLIGAAVPEVALKTEDGTAIDLASALAGKRTILVFYRGGW